MCTLEQKEIDLDARAISACVREQQRGEEGTQHCVAVFAYSLIGLIDLRCGSAPPPDAVENTSRGSTKPRWISIGWTRATRK